METDSANDKNRKMDDGNNNNNNNIIISDDSSNSNNNPTTALTMVKRNPVVRVGVGVLVKDSKDPTRVFCGIRKGSHGAGTLALPG